MDLGGRDPEIRAQSCVSTWAWTPLRFPLPCIHSLVLVFFLLPLLSFYQKNPNCIPQDSQIPENLDVLETENSSWTASSLIPNPILQDNMNRRDDELQLAIYRPPPVFTGGCLEIRLFYVRVTPCAVDSLPDQLKLRHLRRESGVLLEINGARVTSSDAVSINLRRDRVDKDSSEVTYVSTDSVRISGLAEFEVLEDGDDGDLILCGSLERADAEAAWGNESASKNDAESGWGLECYVATSAAKGRSTLMQPRKGACSSPTIEVYIAGCCAGTPVILMKTVLVSPRRKVRQGMVLDAIPEDEEMGKEQRNMCNGLVRQRKLQFMADDMDDYDAEGKITYSKYSEEMYLGEDGQLTLFNAGVRVGVGIGLGMCLGVGIGVGLLMRSYQATTRSFRRRFF